MGLVLIFLIAFIAFVVAQKLDEYGDWDIGAGIFGFFLAIVLIIIPMSRSNTRNTIVQYEVYKKQVEVILRDTPDGEIDIQMEKSNFVQNVIENNIHMIWLQQAKKNNWVNWYIDPQVLDVEIMDLEKIYNGD